MGIISRINKSLKVGFAYKNFAATSGIYHIGLGVAAAKTAEALASKGAQISVIPARHNVDIVRAIELAARKEPLTHLVISAPWLSTYDTEAMVKYFANVRFALNSHSNVGFLQADPRGLQLLRKGLELSARYPNFVVAGNCERFVGWMSSAYHAPVAHLPNIYHIAWRPKVRRWESGKRCIKIGCFGAIRPQKNVMTCAAAALLIRQQTRIPVVLYLSGGRCEGGGEVVRAAIQQMAAEVPGFSVVDVPWCTWDQFHHLVGEMDLLLQVSYTESFNMVTADGASQGVPTVVSRAITWAPESWRADSDDAQDIAHVGRRLLTSRFQSWLGIRALKRHNARAHVAWNKFLA